jgi:hypothetical protein
MEDYARATREPFINCHFCGTESATQWQGYMDGAIESGERAANEVLYSLFDLDNDVRIDYDKTYYAHKELIEKMSNYNIKNGFNISLTTLSKYFICFLLLMVLAIYLHLTFLA